MKQYQFYTKVLLFSVLLGTVMMTKAGSGRIGVAFVHGTGIQTHSSARDYWSWENIESMKSALPNVNYYDIIHCDFNQFMWDSRAAGCLANQVDAFVNRHDLGHVMLVTHSNGGNVVRWILSNPTYSSDYRTLKSKTRFFVNIAATSKGTPLANAVQNGNVFETSLGWLLGYNKDAVKQQQTHWMAVYNQDWLKGTAGRPSLSTHTYNISGSDVDISPTDTEWIGGWLPVPVPDSSPFCGGLHLNTGLKITRQWLNDCSDGFVNCSSQEAVGFKHRDTSFTDDDEPLSHNQSRRKCFGVDRRIKRFIDQFEAWYYGL